MPSHQESRAASRPRYTPRRADPRPRWTPFRLSCRTSSRGYRSTRTPRRRCWTSPRNTSTGWRSSGRTRSKSSRTAATTSGGLGHLGRPGIGCPRRPPATFCEGGEQHPPPDREGSLSPTAAGPGRGGAGGAPFAFLPEPEEPPSPGAPARPPPHWRRLPPPLRTACLRGPRPPRSPFPRAGAWGAASLRSSGLWSPVRTLWSPPPSGFTAFGPPSGIDPPPRPS